MAKQYAINDLSAELLIWAYLDALKWTPCIKVKGQVLYERVAPGEHFVHMAPLYADWIFMLTEDNQYTDIADLPPEDQKFTCNARPLKSLLDRWGSADTLWPEMCDSGLFPKLLTTPGSQPARFSCGEGDHRMESSDACAAFMKAKVALSHEVGFVEVPSSVMDIYEKRMTLVREHQANLEKCRQLAADQEDMAP